MSTSRCYDTIDKMSDAQLVATILGRVTADDECQRLAHVVINEPGRDLIEVAREYAPAATKRVDRIEASLELARRLDLARAKRKLKSLTRPQDVADLMIPIYQDLDKEVFYCLCLTTKNTLIRMVETSVGSLNASIVHPREFLEPAVKCSAASVVMVHNHPSGDPTPSGADIQVTRRVIKAADTLGIEVLDHVVVGKGGKIASLRDDGLM